MLLLSYQMMIVMKLLDAPSFYVLTVFRDPLVCVILSDDQNLYVCVMSAFEIGSAAPCSLEMISGYAYSMLSNSFDVEHNHRVLTSLTHVSMRDDVLWMA